jgi:hypothetical protein
MAKQPEGDLKSQLDAVNERFPKNPLRSSADLATERVSGDYSPEEIRKMMARPVAPAAQSAMDAARANAMGLSGGLPKELLRPVSPDVQATIDAARANVSKMSGGLVSSAATPDAVGRGVSAMNDWRNTGLDEQGNVLSNEERVARHKAEMDAATRARSVEGNQALATRNTQHTLPGEPDRTLALRGDRTLATVPERGAASSTEALAQEALSGNKGVGAILKGVGRKAIPFVGDVAQGYVYGKEGNSVGRGIAAGLGSLGGRLIGGAAGTLVTPGVGTFVGEVGGSFAGAEGGARLYDRVFGGPKPPIQEKVEDAAPAPAAAPAPEEPPRDIRTNQEKFDDAIWNARSKQWADQEQKFKEAGTPEHQARFRAEVEAKRALESAQGAGVSQDPIANARTARIMADSAERLGKATGQDPATLIPAADPRFSNPVEDTAREILQRKAQNLGGMSQSEAVANALIAAPNQYRSPIQDEAQKNAIQAFAPAERVNEAQAQNEDRDLARMQVNENARLQRESTEQTRQDAIAAGQERTKATLIGRQLASIQQQISKLSPNPSAAKMNAPRIAELQAQYKEMAKMDTTGIFGGEDVDSESDSGNITPQPTNAPTKESMKPGQTVVGKDGKTYRWTGTGFVPA